MVGELYPQGDHRRDGAYTIFYMGINLGAFLSPLVCGPLGERVGWGFGFAAAGIGMTLGILTFVFTQRLLMGAGLPPARRGSKDDRLGPRDWIEIAAIAIAIAVLVFAGLAGLALSPAALVPRLVDQHRWRRSCTRGRSSSVASPVHLCDRAEEDRGPGGQRSHEPFTRVDWERITVIVIFSLFSIVFWMGFEQSGGTLNLFADKETNRTMFGYDIPASVFQAVNPVFIITLAPVFAILWTHLARLKFPLPSVAKQGIGLVLLATAFGMMYLASEGAKSGPVSPWWLILVYFIFTVAELFLSPIGLSLVNKLAHPRVASLMMAFWFLCTAAANYLAGIMEKTIEPFHWNLWVFLGLMALVPGLLLLALTPVLVKMSHGRV